MEKKLLLLGLLQRSEMHGYKLIKLLDGNAAVPIKLTKANGYRLLSVMEKDGWVTHTIEKDGKRPKKKVYALAETGKRAFLELLRENLSSLPRPELPGLVGLDLLGFLPPDEAASLLSKRVDLLKQHFHELDGIPEGVRQAHPSMRCLRRYYQAEIEWTYEIIRGLEEDVQT